MPFLNPTERQRGPALLLWEARPALPASLLCAGADRQRVTSVWDSGPYFSPFPSKGSGFPSPKWFPSVLMKPLTS
jgi:hypothetical protein